MILTASRHLQRIVCLTRLAWCTEDQKTARLTGLKLRLHKEVRGTSHSGLNQSGLNECAISRVTALRSIVGRIDSSSAL